MVLKVQSAAAMKRQATLNQKRILHEQQQQALLPVPKQPTIMKLASNYIAVVSQQ